MLRARHTAVFCVLFSSPHCVADRIGNILLKLRAGLLLLKLEAARFEHLRRGGSASPGRKQARMDSTRLPGTPRSGQRGALSEAGCSPDAPLLFMGVQYILVVECHGQHNAIQRQKLFTHRDNRNSSGGFSEDRKEYSSLVSFPLQRERERERESINKKLTCFVGAHTGPGVSDDGEEFSPFLSPAHNNPAEEEA